MPRSVLFRIALFTAIGAATSMAPPAAHAAGPFFAHGASFVSSPHASAGKAWDWLRDLWAKALCVVTPGTSCGSGGVQPDAGCIIDPGGHRIGSPQPAGGKGDAGCTMDPGGHCIGSPQPASVGGDAGCGIDPGGHCPGH
jgi:hypothetical protein